ncbi:MAG: DegV family protein [Firmicutes bacterium]|nr:DegV family protein [Bacillota bacterium]
MKDFVIVTDTGCDLGADLRKEWNIEHIPMSVSKNGEDIVIDLDWKPFSPKEFYNMMRKGQSFKTAAVNTEAYIKAFEPFLEKNIGILYLATSSGLSGSYNSCKIAEKELIKKYPKALIVSVDTLRSCLGQGLICVEAAKMKREGKSIREIAVFVENNKLNVHQAGTVEDLTYLKRAGRVTGMAALMGGLLKVKPLIISDAKGRNVSVSKVRGRKASLRECIRYMQENIISPESQTIYIAHADCPETELEELKQEIKEAVRCKDFYVNYTGPIVGSSVGPGMYGLYFMGKKVEYDAEDLK